MFADRFWFKDFVVNQDPDKDRIGRKIKKLLKSCPVRLILSPLHI